MRKEAKSRPHILNAMQKLLPATKDFQYIETRAEC